MTTTNKHVLYISYNGMLEPLGQSQVIPYLKGLARQGYDFTLVSFERDEAYSEAGRERCARLKQQLAESNIDWHWLRYHRRPSLPATAYDVWAGVRYCKRIADLRPFELVHARSYIPATIALQLKKRTGAKMIFDIRGLMADEYVDAAHWRKGSTAYRITKKFERSAMSEADGIVTLTERIWPIIKEWDGLRGRVVTHEVIPCCADLQRFSFSSQARAERRRTLDVNNRFVFVYSGSIDGWYLTEAMADFFKTVRAQKDNAFLLWLTRSNPDRVKAVMQSRGANESDYAVVAAAPQDVPAYLSAADVGLAFIKQCFSKLASSPTKYAEYLGCGLPLIINSEIGDSDGLVTDEKVGALVLTFDENEYRKAFRNIEGLTAGAELTRQHTREVALRLFDVGGVGLERYARLYENVLNRAGSN